MCVDLQKCTTYNKSKSKQEPFRKCLNTAKSMTVNQGNIRNQ